MGQGQKHKSTLWTSAQTLLLTLVSPRLLDFIVVVTKTQKKQLKTLFQASSLWLCCLHACGEALVTSHELIWVWFTHSKIIQNLHILMSFREHIFHVVYHHTRDPEYF